MVWINYKDYEYAENALEALEEITEYCDSDQGAKIIEWEVLKWLDTFFNRIIQNFSENGHCKYLIANILDWRNVIKILRNIAKIDTYL